MLKKFLAVVVLPVLSLLGFVQTAAAAAPDVTAVVSEVSGAATPIAAIGAAVLLVIVGIKVFKWVRRAM